LGSGVLTTVLLAGFAAGPSTEGSIVGTVHVHTRGERGESVPKADASSVVVYLTGFEQPPPAQTPRISQKNRTFIPDVLAVLVGQSVEFTNDDNLIHNVFSTSKARTFDLGKPRPGESRTVKFDRTGVVDVYCDIHEEMVATVLVLPNRAFAVTGADGRFALRGVPAGRYSLFAWSRRSEPLRIEVEVRPGQESPVDLELTETKFSTAHLGKYGQPYRKQPEYPR
jgi:plastocyanin